MVASKVIPFKAVGTGQVNSFLGKKLSILLAHYGSPFATYFYRGHSVYVFDSEAIPFHCVEVNPSGKIVKIDGVKDRRGEERVPVPEGSSVALCIRGKRVDGRLLDVSLSAMRVAFPSEYSFDHPLEKELVILDFALGGKQGTGLSRVMYVRDDGVVLGYENICPAAISRFIAFHHLSLSLPEVSIREEDLCVVSPARY